MNTRVPTKGMLVSIEGIIGPLMFVDHDYGDESRIMIYDRLGCYTAAPSSPGRNRKFHDLSDISIVVYAPVFYVDGLSFDVRIRTTYVSGNIKKRYAREYMLREYDGTGILRRFGPRMSINSTTQTTIPQMNMNSSFYIPATNISVLTFLTQTGELLSLPAIVDDDVLYCPVYEIIHA